MLTRRKLLTFLGLGGAAAAVASKAEALGETNGAEAHELRVLTYEPTCTPEERARLLDQLRNLDASNAYSYERLDWLGPAPEQAYRRTGRTTRALLAAIEHARTGKTVAYVVAEHSMVQGCMTLAFRHARSVSGDGTRGGIAVLSADGALRTAGIVRIVVNSEPVSPTPASLRGYSEVVYDHAWEPSAGDCLAANEGDVRAFYDEAPFFTLENTRTPDVTMQVYATDAEGVSHYARRPGDQPIGVIEGVGMEPGSAWVRINARDDASDDASASLERGLGRLARASGEEREWAWLREQPAMRNWLDSVGPKLRADGVLRDDEDDEGGWTTHWKNPRA